MRRELKNLRAFTLIELIIVVIILSILGTIAFISIQGYSKSSRDSVRLSDIHKINLALELRLVKAGKIYKPENSIDITASGNLISYQGYMGKNTLNNLGIYGGGKDPLDDSSYTYTTNKQLTKYQILGFLEQEKGLSLLGKTYAIDKEENYPYTKGSQLGILLQSGSLEPAQIEGVNIDIVNTNNEYTAYLDNSNEGIVSGTGTTIFSKFYNYSTDYSGGKELAKLDNSLLLYFDMETTTQSGSLKIMKDFSSYGNNGICYSSNSIVNCGEGNTQFVNWFKGNKSMSFKNSYIRIPENNSIDLPKTYTITIAINPNTIPKGYAVNPIRKGTGWDDNFKIYYFGTCESGCSCASGTKINEACSSGAGRLQMYGGSPHYTIGSDYIIDPLSPDKNFFIYTYDYIKGGQLYVNGIKKGNKKGTGILPVNNLDIYIGNTSDNNTGIEIDEVRIYNRVLSDSEINTLYLGIMKR